LEDFMTTDPNVHRDIGGWISGPSLDRPLPAPVVPPNSSALRQLAHAVAAALTLPGPATSRDELTYLRIHRDRARLVLFAMRRVLADREADDRDVMAVVTALRDQAAQMPSGTYDHSPQS
jgi:hypothetical protein